MADEPTPQDRLLLARLNNLKQSNISLDPRTTTTNASSTPQDLLLRFQKIKGKTPLTTHNPPSTSTSTPPLPTNSPDPDPNPPSPTLDDLLAELGPTDHWTLDPTDAAETHALLAEAARALPTNTTTTTTLPNPAPPPHQPTNDEADEADEAEAASSLQRILDEVHHDQQQQHPQDPASPPTSFAALIFPSPTPTLPSAPTTAPTAHGTPSTGFGTEEIESWCGICCADAAVRCFGCEGERYCWGCWREGHVGPDAGMEEKTHVWERVGGRGRRRRVG